MALSGPTVTDTAPGLAEQVPSRATSWSVGQPREQDQQRNVLGHAGGGGEGWGALAGGVLSAAQGPRLSSLSSMQMGYATCEELNL